MKKFCNNQTCATFKIKVDVDEKECISCGKELTEYNPFADLFDSYVEGQWPTQPR